MQCNCLKYNYLIFRTPLYCYDSTFRLTWKQDYLKLDCHIAKYILLMNFY